MVSVPGEASVHTGLFLYFVLLWQNERRKHLFAFILHFCFLFLLSNSKQIKIVRTKRKEYYLYLSKKS